MDISIGSIVQPHSLPRIHEYKMLDTSVRDTIGHLQTAHPNGLCVWKRSVLCALACLADAASTCTRRGARELITKPCALAVNNVALLVPPRSVQFSSLSSPTFLEHRCTCVTLDARGCLAWNSLGIILFLRSLYSKFTIAVHYWVLFYFSSIITFKVQFTYWFVPWLTRAASFSPSDRPVRSTGSADLPSVPMICSSGSSGRLYS